MRLPVVLLVAVVAATPVHAAGGVEVLDKVELKVGPSQGFVVTYRLNGEERTGTRVYCKSGFRSMFILESLDRGDGVLVDIDVGTEDGTELASSVAPMYMSWAIDLWRLTCR